ncbi:MAG: type II toxin-antitoxin system RelE/ParE family toxin [Bacteroidales bacterium]|nr:type II toxin-antitoxin system RelE/ParE family toxin [Bacteroidales bacterium]
MLKVKWTETAKSSFKEIIAYCILFFSEDTSRKVLQKYEKEIMLLATNPLIGKEELNISDKKHIYRSFPVNRRGRIIYYADETTLHIVDIGDMRMDKEFLENRIR